MLPKIIVGGGDRESFLLEEFLNENFVLTIDGETTNIAEFREWIVFCQNVLDETGEYSVIIWNAGKLSAECQAVLLKPLEEKKPLTKFFLMVDGEMDLLPTIVSRCLVIKRKLLATDEKYWKELVKRWREGPGSLLDFAESFDYEKIEELFVEVALKIKKELINDVNAKRLGVLNIALESLREVRMWQVNKRMVLENFLFYSWKAIKT